MNYRQLGKSGLIVSELCLGTMTFGQDTDAPLKLTFDQKMANKLVDTVIDHGINFFDTADMYSNGESETILGNALKGKRNEIIISSKYAFRAGNQAFNAGINAKHLIEQTEQSLKKLQTDYLDALILHNQDPITPIDETLKALESLVQRGLVRYIGLSNFEAWKAATMVQRQKDLNLQPFTISQMHYSLLNREVEHEFIPMSYYHGLGMMVWSPLSSGFLSGKYTRENPKPKGGRLNTFDLGLFDREQGYAIVEKLIEIAKNHDCTPATIAIAWLLTKKIVSTVIIGVSKMEQLQSNLDASKIILDTKEIDALNELTKPKVRYPATFIEFQDEQLKNAIINEYWTTG